MGDDALAEIFSMSVPALVSQFDLLAGAPGGVARLRELILSLAVRGKLTAQHPTDEPAHVLLQRIQDAKALHVRRGGRRAAGTAVGVNESDLEVLDSLPPGWVWSSLSSIGLISPRNEAEDAATASFVPMSAIPVAFTDAHETESRPWRDIKSGFTHFAEGDVGVAKITPCFENGKSAVFKNLCNGVGAGTTELYVVRPLCGVMPRYVLLFLKSPGFLKGGEAVMTGTAGQKRLPRAYFEDCPFPLPPLAEQARIVARVDELMQLCDALEAKGRLEAQQHARLLETLLGTLTDSTTPEELAANWQRVAEHFDLLLDRPEAVDILEQTVLQLAVRGLLFERDQYGPPECPAEGAVRSAVPYGWTRRQFGDVVNMLNGYAFKSDWFRASGIRLVRNVNVSHGQLDWSQSAFVSTDLAEEFSQFYLTAGDVVLSLDRPIISTGLKLAVIRTIDLPCLLLQRVARLTPDPKALSTRYMELWLSSDRFLNTIDPGRSNGVPHISTKQVAALEIDLPPVDEQARIVARVAELRRFCADLRQRLAASQATQSRLAGALVEAATA